MTEPAPTLFTTPDTRLMRPWLNSTLLILLLGGHSAVRAAPQDLQGDGMALETQRAEPYMEEVIVTARLREEPLQNIPVAMTSFSEPELRLRQILSTDQLGNFVPNLEFDPAAPASGASSVGQIFIRGIGQTDFTPVTDPGVALYLDGVYLARSPGNVMDLVDIERVEVLRGPQGTLFGRNAMGGAIKIHSARPDPDNSERSIEARVGNFDLRSLTLKANLPLSDNAASNIAVNWIEQDGYVERDFDGLQTGDRDRWSARAALAWDISDSVAMFAVIDTARADENGAPTVSGGVNDQQTFGTLGNALLDSCSTVLINPGFDTTPGGGPPSFPPPGAPSGGAEGCFGPESVSPPFRSQGTFPTRAELQTNGLALNLDWTISEQLSVTSITGYRDMTMESSRDGDNTPANIFATVDDYDHQQFSQELQLHYRSKNQRLHALVGLFYFDEEGFNLVDVIVPSGALRSGGFYDNESLAAFSHASFDITRATSLSLGLRYTQDIKGYLPDQFALGDASMGGALGFFEPTWPLLEGRYVAPTGPLAAGTRILDFQRSEERFDQTDYSVDLSHMFTDNITGYLGYATAYKSGGFDQRFVGPTPDRAPSSYLPETVDSVELGVKTRWLNGALQINGALFDARYDDLQVIVRESFNPLTFNAGEASIRGGELEIGWLLDDSWSLDLGLGWLDASYDKLSTSAQNSGVALSNSLVNAPPLNSSMGVTYVTDLGPYGSLQGRVDWIWKGEQFNDAINSPQIRQASYDQVNASISLEAPDSSWQLTLAARNLLNETFLLGGNSAFPTAASYVERVYARPREVYLSARLAF